jgi:prepilin-type N-terminal cleavage/methylation domain-containing protein
VKTNLHRQSSLRPKPRNAWITPASVPSLPPSDFGLRTSFGPRISAFGFTLLELLVVISIIGLIAAIAVPSLTSFRPNMLNVASRQLLDDLQWARQRAISDHTTVYVVFVPSVASLSFPNGAPVVADQQRVLQAQYVSYALYVNHQLGDQPGGSYPRYLTGWKSLPAGIAIAPQKFNGVGAVPPTYGPAYNPSVVTFNGTNICWTFDVTDASCNPDNGKTPDTYLPYVSFDYRGSLSSPWHTDGAKSGHCVIPLTRGIVIVQKNAAGLPVWGGTTAFNENPVGCWNDPTLHTYIVIDGPTGRAHVERAQVQ